MKSRYSTPLVAIILIFTVSALAAAQDFGRQTGTVRDVNGNPISDVTVTAGNNTTKTDVNGKFAFTRLPAQIYFFTFEKEGYRPARVQKQVAAIFNNRPLEITMESLGQAQPLPGEGPSDAELVQEGQQLIRSGDVRGGLEKLEAVLAKSPDNLEDPNIINARFFAAVANLQLMNYKKAIDYLLPLAEKMPEHPGVNLILGEAYFYNKEFAQALPYYEKLISLERADANIYLNMGVALEGTEAKDDAIFAFTKAIEIDPTLDDAYWRLGLALTLQEKYAEAIPYLEKYLEMQSNSPYAEEVEKALRHSLLEHGIALYNAGNTAEATPVLQKLVEKYPDSEEAAKAKVLLEEQQ